MRVAVLHSAVGKDATPDDLDTLAQREAISNSLVRLGHEPVSLSFSLDLHKVKKSLEEIGPDLVFNLVESVDGTGRLIHFAPALLDHLNINFTGSSADALYLTSNKLLSKSSMRFRGLPVPDWIVPEEASANGPIPPGRLIIKSVWEHASVGLDDSSLVEPRNGEELYIDMKRRMRSLGGSCFAESYIPGREFNLALLENEGNVRILPPAEMVFDEFPDGKPCLVGYRAKWDDRSFEYLHTNRSFEVRAEDEELVAKMSELAQASFRHFDLRGYARVDFRVDPKGKPFILEVNANPCISPDAGFIAAAGKAGLEYDQVIESIVGSALDKERGSRICSQPSKRSGHGQCLKAAGGSAESGGAELTYRENLHSGDRLSVEKIVRSSGFFSEAETALALELVDLFFETGLASGYHFLMADLGDETIGYCCFGPAPVTLSSYNLYWIAVDNEHRRRKLGHAVLEESERRIASLGGNRVYAETSGRPQYEPTHRFYENNGYVKEAVMKDFYSPGDDKVVYVKRLM